MTTALLLAIPALPLVLAFAFAARPLRPLAKALVPLAPLPALAVALMAPLAADLPWLGLGGRMESGGMRSGFLLFTALLWALAGVAALAYLRGATQPARFYVPFLLAMGGNLGLLVAADAMSFYALFAIMSLASWGLVLHDRNDFARFAGRVYIGFAVAGELALFAGLSLAASAAGSILLADLAGAEQPMLATWLLILGFGIKLGAVPLHLWLPLAHAAAPAPASAVLSGAMIKAGLFGMAVTLPLGAAALSGPGIVLAACGGASILLAALVGVTQSNPKAVLAYSSVGQMGLVAIVLGVALAEPGAWPLALPALAVFAAHHGFAKAALFLGVPALWAARGRMERGAVLALLAMPALALAAAPWTSGAVAKAGVGGVFSAGPEGWSSWLYPLLLAGSAGTTLLMVRFLVLMSRQEAKPGLSRLTAVPWAAMTALAGAGLWLPTFEAAALGADPLSDLMPVVAALGLAALVAAAMVLGGLRAREVAPGEVLALFEARPARPFGKTAPRPTAWWPGGLPRPHLPRRAPAEIGPMGGVALLGVAAVLLAAVLFVGSLRDPSATSAGTHVAAGSKGATYGAQLMPQDGS